MLAPSSLTDSGTRDEFHCAVTDARIAQPVTDPFLAKLLALLCEVTAASNLVDREALARLNFLHDVVGVWNDANTRVLHQQQHYHQHARADSVSHRNGEEESVPPPGSQHSRQSSSTGECDDKVDSTAEEDGDPHARLHDEEEDVAAAREEQSLRLFLRTMVSTDAAILQHSNHHTDASSCSSSVNSSWQDECDAHVRTSSTGLVAGATSSKGEGINSGNGAAELCVVLHPHGGAARAASCSREALLERVDALRDNIVAEILGQYYGLHVDRGGMGDGGVRMTQDVRLMELRRSQAARSKPNQFGGEATDARLWPSNGAVSVEQHAAGSCTSHIEHAEHASLLNGEPRDLRAPCRDDRGEYDHEGEADHSEELPQQQQQHTGIPYFHEFVGLALHGDATVAAFRLLSRTLVRRLRSIDGALFTEESLAAAGMEAEKRGNTDDGGSTSNCDEEEDEELDPGSTTASTTTSSGTSWRRRRQLLTTRPLKFVVAPRTCAPCLHLLACFGNQHLVVVCASDKEAAATFPPRRRAAARQQQERDEDKTDAATSSPQDRASPLLPPSTTNKVTVGGGVGKSNERQRQPSECLSSPSVADKEEEDEVEKDAQDPLATAMATCCSRPPTSPSEWGWDATVVYGRLLEHKLPQEHQARKPWLDEVPLSSPSGETLHAIPHLSHNGDGGAAGSHDFAHMARSIHAGTSASPPSSFVVLQGSGSGENKSSSSSSGDDDGESGRDVSLAVLSLAATSSALSTSARLAAREPQKSGGGASQEAASLHRLKPHHHPPSTSQRTASVGFSQPGVRQGDAMFAGELIVRLDFWKVRGEHPRDYDADFKAYAQRIQEEEASVEDSLWLRREILTTTATATNNTCTTQRNDPSAQHTSPPSVVPGCQSPPTTELSFEVETIPLQCMSVEMGSLSLRCSVTSAEPVGGGGGGGGKHHLSESDRMAQLRSKLAAVRNLFHNTVVSVVDATSTGSYVKEKAEQQHHHRHHHHHHRSAGGAATFSGGGGGEVRITVQRIQWSVSTSHGGGPATSAPSVVVVGGGPDSRSPIPAALDSTAAPMTGVTPGSDEAEAALSRCGVERRKLRHRLLQRNVWQAFLFSAQTFKLKAVVRFVRKASDGERNGKNWSAKMPDDDLPGDDGDQDGDGAPCFDVELDSWTAPLQCFLARHCACFVDLDRTLVDNAILPRKTQRILQRHVSWTVATSSNSACGLDDDDDRTSPRTFPGASPKISVKSEVVFLRPGIMEFLSHWARLWRVRFVLVTKSTRTRAVAILSQLADPNAEVFGASDSMDALGNDDEDGDPPRRGHPCWVGDNETSDGSADASRAASTDVLSGRCNVNNHSTLSSFQPRIRTNFYRVYSAEDLVPDTPLLRSEGRARYVERLLRAQKSVASVYQLGVCGATVTPKLETLRYAILDDTPYVWVEDDWMRVIPVEPFTLRHVDRPDEWSVQGCTALRLVQRWLFGPRSKRRRHPRDADDDDTRPGRRRLTSPLASSSSTSSSCASSDDDDAWWTTMMPPTTDDSATHHNNSGMAQPRVESDDDEDIDDACTNNAATESSGGAMDSGASMWGHANPWDSNRGWHLMGTIEDVTPL